MLAGRANVKELRMRAKVIRKDGSVEDLGVITYESTNLFKVFLWKVKNKLRRK